MNACQREVTIWGKGRALRVALQRWRNSPRASRDAQLVMYEMHPEMHGVVWGGVCGVAGVAV